MKTLTVLALVCAVTALTGAAPPREEKADKDQPADVNLVKRWTGPGCSSPWFRSNGRCFLYVPRLMTWAKAEKHCQSLGGNLVSVHSHQEYLQIQIMMIAARHGYEETWIGGSDGQEEKYCSERWHTFPLHQLVSWRA
ncbi:ladderlectin [Etheostoma spectabile]|uniref:ladderlectin n=1 Tax=Etheostoma spectabile TaxID=54343 RepID=UPI0013AEA2A7|nr:ladderlectin-like [Etheostoma spectabile]